MSAFPGITAKGFVPLSWFSGVASITSVSRPVAVWILVNLSTNATKVAIKARKLAFMPLKASSWPILSSLLITKLLPNQSRATLPIPETNPENVLLIMPIWIVRKVWFAKRPKRLWNSSQNWGAAVVVLSVSAPLKLSTSTPWFSASKTNTLRVFCCKVGKKTKVDTVINAAIATASSVSLPL